MTVLVFQPFILAAAHAQAAQRQKPHQLLHGNIQYAGCFLVRQRENVNQHHHRALLDPQLL